MFVWTDKKIHWYQEAANFTKYYKDIFKAIAPFISKNDTVCDLGCGLGDLSIELSKIAKSVTAIDISQDALDVLKSKIAAQNINNLKTVQSNWTDIAETPQWDIVVVSFFRQNYEDFIKLLKKVNKRIIVVTTNGSEDNFLPKQKKHHNRGKIASLKVELDKHNLNYECLEQTLQFGQPVSSIEDARAYIKQYVPECEESVMEEHIKNHLQKITDGEFANQYYFSNKKEIGIFIIEKEEASRKLPEFK